MGPHSGWLYSLLRRWAVQQMVQNIAKPSSSWIPLVLAFGPPSERFRTYVRYTASVPYPPSIDLKLSAILWPLWFPNFSMVYIMRFPWALVRCFLNQLKLPATPLSRSPNHMRCPCAVPSYLLLDQHIDPFTCLSIRYDTHLFNPVLAGLCCDHRPHEPASLFNIDCSELVVSNFNTLQYP